MVDENGVAVILKNNRLEKEEIVENIEVDEVPKKILSKHMGDFKKLTKRKGLLRNRL